MTLVAAINLVVCSYMHALLVDQSVHPCTYSSACIYDNPKVYIQPHDSSLCRVLPMQLHTTFTPDEPPRQWNHISTFTPTKKETKAPIRLGKLKKYTVVRLEKYNATIW